MCLTEKYHLIEYFNDIRLLNKKSEFINACRHQSKLLLKNLKRNDSMDWKNIKGTCREVFLLIYCVFLLFLEPSRIIWIPDNCINSMKLRIVF